MAGEEIVAGVEELNKRKKEGRKGGEDKIVLAV
jgi:hypothetical protein